MIKSIKKATDVLYALANEPEKPVPLGKLAERIGINKTTCAHILNTLCETALVERVSRHEGYRLGPGCFMLSRYGRYRQSLVEICMPVMSWLKEQLDATVLVAVVSDGSKYIVQNIEGQERLQYDASKIIKGHVIDTATGILLMAYMDKDRLERVYSRQKENEKDELLRQIIVDANQENLFRQIRTDGYYHLSVESEDRQAFSFRVWDGRDTVAAIGVLYSNEKDSIQMRKLVVSKGKIASAEISRRLIANREQENLNEREKLL